MHIGCCTACLVRFLPLSESLRRIEDLGFEVVEINASGDGAFLPDMDEGERDRVIRAIESSGIPVNLHIDLNYIYRRAVDAGKPYDVLFRELVDPFLALARSRRAPVKIVSFDPLHDPRSLRHGVGAGLRRLGRFLAGYDARDTGRRGFRRQETFDALRAARRGSGGAAVDICFENHVSGTATIDELRELKRFLPEKVGLLLDLGHACLAQRTAGPEEISLSEYIRRVPLDICDVHVSDNDGMRDLHLFPGQGRIDFSAAIAALSDRGYQGPLVIEATSARRETVESRLTEAMLLLQECVSAAERKRA